MNKSASKNITSSNSNSIFFMNPLTDFVPICHINESFNRYSFEEIYINIKNVEKSKHSTHFH